MIGNALSGIRTNFEKAVCEFKFLKNHSYPDFVYATRASELREEVPVFCFHSVEPLEFEAQLKFLAANEYQTLRADNLHEYLTRDKKVPSKAVLLTFDDGWQDLWTVAYPLLRKYGLSALSFIVPKWISDDEIHYPNLSDHWDNGIPLDEIQQRARDCGQYITWRQAREMQASGVIDFQSHSMTHSTVFTSDKIVDFLNPRSFKNEHKIPVLKSTKSGEQRLRDLIGIPLYTVAPRLSGARRYYDDPRLRNVCREYVSGNGGTRFFSKRSWRRELEEVVVKHKSESEIEGRYESDAERHTAIEYELAESKAHIESRLGNTVKHLCYPFFAGSELALRISRDCGYKTNFWGWQAPDGSRNDYYGMEHRYEQVDITDFSVGESLAGRRTNRFADDPYRVVRIPADYIFRLPGNGRQTLSQIMFNKVLRNLKKLGH